MDREHLSNLATLARLSQALWASPRHGSHVAVETFAAVSLLELGWERRIERIAQAMLERALRDGTAANTRVSLAMGAMDTPFFRLPPEQRFALIGLHQGRWSYERLSRVMKIAPDRLETLAWQARLALAASGYPTGSSTHGAHCPEYDPQKPWTQRFLDEEFPNSRERVFLQNHMMACDRCRQALTRCRNLYYAVEAALPPPSSEPLEALEKTARLARSSHARMRIDQHIGQVFLHSLKLFARRWDVRAVGILGAGFALAAALKFGGLLLPPY